MKQKLFSIIALLLMAVTGAMAQTTYTVVGSNAAMFGSAWDPSSTANDMTKNGDGTYSITYTNVNFTKTEEVQYKVVKDHSWGEVYPYFNRVINIAKPGTYTMTIHFNPTTHEVYETMPGYTVSLADGTEDATNWTIEPKMGLNGDGTETVTITYNGTKRVKSVKAVKVDAAPAAVTTATPLTMECLSDGTIKVNMSSEMTFGMQYAVNGGDKKKITTTTTIGDLTKGDKVQFYGVLTGTQAYGSSPSVMISGGSATVKVYGNIMSLVDETGFANNTELKSANAFTGLFYGNDKLTDASGLLLPATTLNQDCYANMFTRCTALTAAPELPATELVNGCYYKMFAGCTKLATVTCKATKEITVFYGLDNWLEGAGTDESITSRTLYVDPTMVSNTGWQNANFTVTASPATDPLAADKPQAHRGTDPL